jgi:hypothetical protein
MLCECASVCEKVGGGEEEMERRDAERRKSWRAAWREGRSVDELAEDRGGSGGELGRNTRELGRSIRMLGRNFPWVGEGVAFSSTVFYCWSPWASDCTVNLTGTFNSANSSPYPVSISLPRVSNGTLLPASSRARQ